MLLNGDRIYRYEGQFPELKAFFSELRFMQRNFRGLSEERVIGRASRIDEFGLDFFVSGKEVPLATMDPGQSLIALFLACEDRNPELYQYLRKEYFKISETVVQLYQYDRIWSNKPLNWNGRSIHKESVDSIFDFMKVGHSLAQTVATFLNDGRWE